MEVFKAKSKKGVLYNRHFPADFSQRKQLGFIRAGGLNFASFSQEDAASLRKVNPELFNKLFTVETIFRKKIIDPEPTE